jgi:diadenylate cyclase
MWTAFAVLPGAAVFWTEAGKFVSDLLDSLASGILFFGGPLDIARAVADILVTTFVVYFVLRLMRDSRAWQLVKGIVLILVFAQLCVLLGLSTVGFILGNTLSVLAIAFVVLFQPELRRALETVGRRSLSFLAGALVEESPQSGHSVHNTIEEIVRACDRMSESRTGALIVLERETRMGELAEQENSVILDAAVSSSMLQQIFYKGSPLHDGAVLIRNGRILAARCHIPLSDNLHLRRDYGTRHRAAVGASEMGDAIAVVVSEERGTISVSFEGRLYAMESSDSLRILLHKLLGSKQPGVISSLLRGRSPSHEADSTASAGISPEASEAAEADLRSHGAKTTAQTAFRLRLPKGRQLLMIVTSLVLACMLWFYVQVTTNPVESKLYTVPVRIVHTDGIDPKDLVATSTTGTVGVTVTGRRNSLAALPAEAVLATVDLSETTTAGSFTFLVDVEIVSKGYYRIAAVAPASTTVKVGVAAKAGVG